ncbi:hypothetical protein BAUCODRAFT_412266 [Baudoinia panamericana UAMH 10762]|uniref:Uncharacterized protein n=1 Tax=Baudoinia panamericana (strain UAMH 10762) TaxID=717646 RepID=M2N2D0_BAUPA|nr:uncharacterized protein BAUCODRAFT_412266 [Baudoinia panamericana UAMH 10762]EMC98073.1 hypothetical protein BAUCODRAFT_412266 [Baudoinia panamericana UAMH 10762]
MRCRTRSTSSCSGPIPRVLAYDSGTTTPVATLAKRILTWTASDGLLRACIVLGLTTQKLHIV